MKKYLTIKTASETYDISAIQLRSLCLLGKLEATKPNGGRKWFIAPRSIERYIEGYPSRTEKEVKQLKIGNQLKTKNMQLMK